MTGLKPLIRLAVILPLLCAPALAADFAKGAQAYDGGDYKTAYGEWIALARQGDSMAQIAIANMYRQGEGRRPDPAAAFDWYRKAARAGAPIAQINLAEMFERGAGTGRDLPRAWHWYDRAARQGNQWAAEQKSRLERTLTPGQMRKARALERGPE